MISMKEKLTERQQEVFDFIETYIDEYLYPPAQADICLAFGFTNTAARDHIDALVRKGWIEKAPNKSRALRIL